MPPKTHPALRSAVLLGGLCLAAASLATAAELSGLPVVDENFQKPAGTLLVDHLQTSAAVTNSTGLDFDKNRDLSQSFTVLESGTIDKIAINFETFSTTGSATPVVFEFFRVADPAAETLTPDGPIIDTLSFTAEDITALGFVSGDEGTLIFDVADTAAVANDAFAIRFDTQEDPGQTTTHIVKWRRDNPGTYPDGRAYSNNVSPPGDFIFGVVGTTGATLPFSIIDIDYAPEADEVTLTWRARPATTYRAFSSTDLADWGNELADSLGFGNDEIEGDGDLITVTFVLADGLENEADLFFRIAEQ